MKKYFREPVLWILILLPYVYLATIWNRLPDRVPTHFNLAGSPDDWSGKSILLFLPGALGIGVYLLMLAIPFLDPKKKIRQMGNKYYTFRFMLTAFFSVFAIYLLYVSNTGSMRNPNFLIALIGILFAMLGNYFQAVRPNYFIGIRTPWTLESETVWKKTHRMAGPIWMGGGILMAVISFLVSNNTMLAVIMGGFISIMVIMPLIYSYMEFQKEKKMLQE
jgi:uncharacterized membrane protein